MFDMKSAGASALERSSGFTMVELVVTIAIASVLLGIAVPSFNQMIVSSRLTTQSNEMIAAISFARSEAIKRNGSLSFCRVGSETATACAAVTGNWQHWIVRTAAGNVVRRGVVNTFGGTIVVQSTLSNDTAVFGSDGLMRSGGALNNRQISVCSTRRADNNARQITVGAGSRVSTLSLNQQCGA